MAIHFKTLGPFELKRTSGVVDNFGLTHLWEKANAVQEGLSKGVGVYLIATGRAGSLTPWYVGKSDGGFKGRLSENHHAFNLIAERQPKGNLYLFLFAKVSAKRGVLNKPLKKKNIERGDDYRGSRKPRKSISKLEFLLIGSCMTRNPELVNAKEKIFHAGLIVPGYLNYDQGDLSDSALSLGKMLGTT